MEEGMGNNAASVKVFLRHAMEGRLRLRVTPPSQAQKVGEVCRSLAGVQSVRVNPACAAVVLTYQPAQTSAEAARELLRLRCAPACGNRCARTVGAISYAYRRHGLCLCA